MKRTRIRPRSEKRERLMVQRRALVQEVLLAHPRCQVQGCTNDSQQVHEPLTRARGGSIIDPANALAVCGSCHRRIHDEPAWATALGLLVASWEA